MAQFARPISDITNPAGLTGTFADIDEVSASDTDFIVSDDNTEVTCEFLLGTVSTPDANNATIVRFRHSKADTGVPNSTTGNTQTFSAWIYQGATLICTIASNLTMSAWVDGSYLLTTGEHDSITDWSDLRIRFTIAASGGGSPGIRRGGAISWSELETADAVVVGGTNIQQNVGGAWKVVDGMQINIGGSWKTVASVKQNIGGAWKDVF